MKRTRCPQPTSAFGVSTTPPCATRMIHHSRNASKSWLVRRLSSSSSGAPWKSKGFANYNYFIFQFFSFILHQYLIISNKNPKFCLNFEILRAFSHSGRRPSGPFESLS